MAAKSSSFDDGWMRALVDAGQAHVLQHWDALNERERTVLRQDVESVDLRRIERLFRTSMDSGDSAGKVEPVQEVFSYEKRSENERRLKKLGLQLIAEGKVAVILLAGGQGTRLGSTKPKGCYDIGLPSGKSLFQLQAERIQRMQTLAAEHMGLEEVKRPIKWYIMTSSFTEEETRQFFVQHRFFGLEPSQVTFFSQGSLPCLTPEGKLILKTSFELAWAPDGNGGIYRALKTSGCLEEMQHDGVECIDCFSVDNALARVCDPVFLGACVEQNAECGARVLAKAYPEEKVGVFAIRDGKLEVVEYSELPPSEAAATDPLTGQLRFNWSNICMHFFTPAFLDRVCDILEAQGLYHVAQKSIPSVDGPIPGIKLELFIFDSFPLAKHTLLVEVKREEEFSPVKNAPGSAMDSPDTARASILALHSRWIREAGGIPDGESVEVSPLLSYAGEGLVDICTGQKISNLSSIGP